MHFTVVSLRVRTFYLEEIRVFKAGSLSLNTLAWDNRIGLLVLFCWFLRTRVMMNRNSWGHSYSIARGEILRLIDDELLRKHLPRMFPLIKNES
jgi:hypothetical protein